MPCWYYDKKELRNTPSFRDGIDPETEARYRREGARFILDTGSKMGLRYDSCATGVVYFHRFYMFHSFREFHRYVMGSCCLFLAGKVEETPKKCKDIVKHARSLLTDAQFMVFGDDPKEEVMTLERVLLQTIKFDLQLKHPYQDILNFANLIKGDKAKIQKMVQMAWTFINDSLCTTLCLQWESEIISVALIFLASKLSKYEITDWKDKPPGYKKKWYEFFEADLTLELLEDICHQVLDLYSSSSQKKEESPPPPPPPGTSPASTGLPQQKVHHKKQISPSAGVKPVHPAVHQLQSAHNAQHPIHPPIDPSPVKVDRERRIERSRSPSPKRQKTKLHTSIDPAQKARERKLKHAKVPQHAPPPQPPPPQAHPTRPEAPPDKHDYNAAYHQSYQSGESYSTFNPYVSQQMYSSSFMSQEGSQSIQSLIAPPPQSGSYTQQQVAPPQYSKTVQQGQYTQQAVYTPPAQQYQARTQHQHAQRTQGAYHQPHQHQQQHQPQATSTQSQAQYQQLSYSQTPYQATRYAKPPSTAPPPQPSYQHQSYSSELQFPPPAPAPTSTNRYPYKTKSGPIQPAHPPTRPPPPVRGLLPTPGNQAPPGVPVNATNLTTVRISGRR